MATLQCMSMCKSPHVSTGTQLGTCHCQFISEKVARAGDPAGAAQRAGPLRVVGGGPRSSRAALGWGRAGGRAAQRASEKSAASEGGLDPLLERRARRAVCLIEPATGECRPGSWHAPFYAPLTSHRSEATVIAQLRSTD